MALSRTELDWLGRYENIRLLCLQTVRARSGALRTLQTTPPPIPPNFKIGLLEAHMLGLQNTVAVNFAGNPAVALPIPLHVAEVAVTSLQPIGPRLGEAQLLNAGRLVKVAVKRMNEDNPAAP